VERLKEQTNELSNKRRSQTVAPCHSLHVCIHSAKQHQQQQVTTQTRDLKGRVYMSWFRLIISVFVQSLWLSLCCVLCKADLAGRIHSCRSNGSMGRTRRFEDVAYNDKNNSTRKRETYRWFGWIAWSDKANMYALEMIAWWHSLPEEVWLQSITLHGEILREAKLCILHQGDATNTTILIVADVIVVSIISLTFLEWWV
jgi:hypothetical protein